MSSRPQLRLSDVLGAQLDGTLSYSTLKHVLRSLRYGFPSYPHPTKSSAGAATRTPNACIPRTPRTPQSLALSATPFVTTTPSPSQVFDVSLSLSQTQNQKSSQSHSQSEVQSQSQSQPQSQDPKQSQSQQPPSQKQQRQLSQGIATPASSAKPPRAPARSIAAAAATVCGAEAQQRKPGEDGVKRVLLLGSQPLAAEVLPAEATDRAGSPGTTRKMEGEGARSSAATAVRNAHKDITDDTKAAAEEKDKKCIDRGKELEKEIDSEGSRGRLRRRRRTSKRRLVEEPRDNEGIRRREKMAKTMSTVRRLDAELIQSEEHKPGDGHKVTGPGKAIAVRKKTRNRGRARVSHGDEQGKEREEKEQTKESDGKPVKGRKERPMMTSKERDVVAGQINEILAELADTIAPATATVELGGCMSNDDESGERAGRQRLVVTWAMLREAALKQGNRQLDEVVHGLEGVFTDSEVIASNASGGGCYEDSAISRWDDGQSAAEVDEAEGGNSKGTTDNANSTQKGCGAVAVLLSREFWEEMSAVMTTERDDRTDADENCLRVAVYTQDVHH